MNQVEALRKLGADYVSDHEGIIYTLDNAIEGAVACKDTDEGDYNVIDRYIVADNDGTVHWTAIPNRVVVPMSKLLGNDSTPISTWDLLTFMGGNWGDDMRLVRVDSKGVVWFRDELLATPFPATMDDAMADPQLPILDDATDSDESRDKWSSLKAERDALRLELAAKESELLFQTERIININACTTVEHRRKEAVIAALRAELADLKQKFHPVMPCQEMYLKVPGTLEGFHRFVAVPCACVGLDPAKLTPCKVHAAGQCWAALEKWEEMKTLPPHPCGTRYIAAYYKYACGAEYMRVHCADGSQMVVPITLCAAQKKRAGEASRTRENLDGTT